MTTQAWEPTSEPSGDVSLPPQRLETLPKSESTPRSETSSASLVAGILTDVQRLVEQQLHLARREMERDLQQALKAGFYLALGAGGLLGGLAVASISLAHFLHWQTAPAGMDPAQLPLWACYLVVAALLAAIGGWLLAIGRHKFSHLTPLETTAAAAEETVTWAMNPK